MRELFLIKCSSYFQSDILKRSQGTFSLRVQLQVYINHQVRETSHCRWFLLFPNHLNECVFYLLFMSFFPLGSPMQFRIEIVSWDRNYHQQTAHDPLLPLRLLVNYFQSGINQQFKATGITLFHQKYLCSSMHFYRASKGNQFQIKGSFTSL